MFCRKINDPSLVVFSNGDSSEINQMFITAENQVIVELNTTKLIDGLIHLMAIYYVMDVSYPKCCKPTYFFLQDVLMGDLDEFPRPTRYSTFVSTHFHSYF